jgi:PKD repeat protein
MGAVTDDGLPNPPGVITATWTELNGPGTVTFGNSNALATIANFSVAGSYVLRLTANDGQYSASSNTTITVKPWQQLVVSPQSLSYGNVMVGNNSNRNFVVINTGGQNLSGTASAAAPFGVIAGSSYEVLPGQTNTVTVAFSPIAAGVFAGQVIFASNGGNSTNIVTGWGAIPPVAGFTAGPTNGAAPLTVTFTNTSVGTITNCLWDFGDTATSNTLAVTVPHTYSAGTYPVTLVASGPVGVSTNTRIDCIVVTNPPPPSGGYWQVVTNASPVAYWRLNETNGATIAADFFGSHNGTISVSVTPGVSGPQSPAFPGFETNNTAIRFNYTSGSYLTMPALSLNTNTVTITGWINPTGNQAGWAAIAFCRDGSTVAGLDFGPGAIPNELRYHWNNSRFDRSTGLAAPTGQWSFVALVVTPTNATIYLGTNGLLNSFADTVSEPSQGFNSSLRIGYDPSDSSRLFRGAIDEVAIYNHSLTPTQIQQLYTSALTLPPPPPTPFQTWQLQYFICTNCPQAASTADPDGDGQDNMTEFLAGTDPNDSASAFRITSIAPEGDDFRITWMTGIGRSNALQLAPGDAGGGYSNNFIDLFVVTNTVGITTNYLDAGAATNTPARCYRVRLVP